MHAHKKIVTTI